MAVLYSIACLWKCSLQKGPDIKNLYPSPQISAVAVRKRTWPQENSRIVVQHCNQAIGCFQADKSQQSTKDCWSNLSPEPSERRLLIVVLAIEESRSFGLIPISTMLVISPNLISSNVTLPFVISSNLITLYLISSTEL